MAHDVDGSWATELRGAGTAALVRAQDTWEYSPYRVQVWLACRPSARCRSSQQTILAELRTQTPVYAGATWH